MNLGDQQKQNERQNDSSDSPEQKPASEVFLETSAPSAKPKRFAFAAILGVAAVAKLLIWPGMQTAFYEFKHRSGHGWDDSRAEFQKYYEDEYKTFGGTLPVKYAADLATCQANAYVTWLNKSDCRRYRISFITSAAEHERQTAACLSNAGEAEFVKVNGVDCIKKTIPNKWSEFESVYATRFSEKLTKTKLAISDDKRKLLSDCIAKKYIERLMSVATETRSDCGPLNMAGTDLESLLDSSNCQHERVTAEIAQFTGACFVESEITAH